jgi:hypothetical protein
VRVWYSAEENRNKDVPAIVPNNSQVCPRKQKAQPEQPSS